MYTIALTRGRSFSRKIRITKGGVPYIPQAGEVIRFGVKERFAQKDYLIRKEFIAADVKNGVIELVLTPRDTAGLALQTYQYDIGIQRGMEYFDIITASDFVLRGNVTGWEAGNG